MYNYQYPMMNGSSYGWGFGMSVLFLIAFAFFITVLIYLWRSRHYATASKATPLEIVTERYARGEIKKDEFAQLKKDVT